MSEHNFILIKLGEADARYWAGCRETIKDDYWFDTEELLTNPQFGRTGKWFKTVPDWFWPRFAEKILSGEGVFGAEGWVELTQAEYETYSNE